jgi:flagellar hook-length control protein FliK
MNGERDTSSIHSAVAGRLGQTPTSETKPAKDAVPKDAPRNSTVPSKPQQSSTVTEFERLIRLVRTQSGRQSSTRVLLDPPELGKVYVRVIVEGDRVEVGVETENDAARQLISERAVKLKTALEEHGLVIDRFDVTTNQSGMFEQRFLAGQETLWPREDSGGSDTGRGLPRRPGGTSGDVRASAVADRANAGWYRDKELDIQV